MPFRNLIVGLCLASCLLFACAPAPDSLTPQATLAVLTDTPQPNLLSPPTEAPRFPTLDPDEATTRLAVREMTLPPTFTPTFTPSITPTFTQTYTPSPTFTPTIIPSTTLCQSLQPFANQDPDTIEPGGTLYFGLGLEYPDYYSRVTVSLPDSDELLVDVNIQGGEPIRTRFAFEELPFEGEYNWIIGIYDYATATERCQVTGSFIRTAAIESNDTLPTVTPRPRDERRDDGR